ncbi:hypothetical protein WA556_004885 [Blastocystis sp. ATCC 50177/Nand II]
MGTSILFVSLLNYLQRNPNAHVVLIRKQEIGYGFRLRLLQSQNRSSPLLKQIHIKYLSSASELNQFIVASRLSYEYDLLAIDNWGDFFKESTAVVKMSKTLGLLKELGVPSLLLDNQLNSTALKEYDSFFRSSFSSILQIHIVSPSLYSVVSLSPYRGDDGAVSFRVAEHSIQLQSS